MTTAVMSISPTNFYPKVEIIKQETTPSVERHKHETEQTQDPQTHTTIRESTRVHRRKSKYDRAIVGRYKLIHTIGTGNFAKVKLANHLITGKEVAIKIIDKTELSSSSRRKLSREVKLMKVLNHPNIVRLLEIIDTEKMMYLVMEYASGGELYEYLVEHGRMTEKLAREKFRQILSAVQYCHQKRIIHRDLKTENLLLDANFNIKLADFGFANEFQEGTKLNTFCGSPPYAAPELFRGKEYDGPEVDVWSLGVILFKLVSGALPFDGRSLSELRESVLRGRYRIPFYMSTECERLLKKMLVLNPAKRHSLESIMKDRWVNIGYEDNPLSPYVEPKADLTDPARIDIMMNMGFSLDAIIKSLKHGNFDEITATYHLLEKQETTLDSKMAPVITKSVEKIGSSGQVFNSYSSKTNQENAETVVSQRNSIKQSSEFNSIPVTITRDEVCNEAHKKNDSKLMLNGTHNVTLPTVDEKEINGLIHNNTEPLEKVIMVYGNVDKDRQVPESSTEANEVKETFNGRPKTIYEFKNHEDVDKTSKINKPDRSPTHWYPTAGVGIRNGVVTSGDGSVVARKQNTEEGSVWQKPVEVPSSRFETKTDSQMKCQVERIQPAYAWSIPTSTVVQVESIPTTTLDISEIKPKLSTNEPVQFVRLDPVRQTVHSTNRPQLEQQINVNNVSPGKAEDKNARVAVARTNLADLGSVGEDKLVVENSGLNKQRGFFRTLTSRFSKRSRPVIEKSATIAVREETDRKSLIESESKPKELTLGQQISESNETRITAFQNPGRNSTRPCSQISSNSNRLSKEIDNSCTNNLPTMTDESSFGSQNSQDANENSPFGFLRNLALRMSKKKSIDYSPVLDSSAMNPSQENKRSTMRHQNSFSFLPPTIITSVQKEPNSTNEQNSMRHIENSRTIAVCTDTTRNTRNIGRPVSVSNSSSGSSKKPRVLRFTWSMKLTSKLPPEEIVQEIKRVLDKNKYNYEHRQTFLFICETGMHNTDKYVQWEMEVCELLRQGVYGVRFHKISGTALAYKHAMTSITQEMSL